MTDLDRGESRGRTFWAGVAGGGLVMGYGVVGLVRAAPRTLPLQTAASIVGAAAVNDLFVVPIALVVGVTLARIAPRALRAPIAAFLIVGAPIALAAFPLVRGYGRNPANPSVLPGDYRSGLAVTLATAAVGVALVSIARWRVAAGRRRCAPTGVTRQ